MSKFTLLQFSLQNWQSLYKKDVDTSLQILDRKQMKEIESYLRSIWVHAKKLSSFEIINYYKT